MSFTLQFRELVPLFLVVLDVQSRLEFFDPFLQGVQLFSLASDQGQRGYDFTNFVVDYASCTIQPALGVFYNVP